LYCYFSDEELEIIHSKLQYMMPTGELNCEQFQAVFPYVFIFWDEFDDLLPGSVFQTIDEENTGIITKDQFMHAISVIYRGTLHEKWRYTKWL